MEKLSGTQTRIIELANLIHQSVSELQDVLSTQGISTPSFHENASGHIPPETFYVRDMILDATSELYDLLLDPLTLLFQKGAVIHKTIW
jgi:hypothetical protein